MSHNTINTRPLAIPRGVTYCLGCKWPPGGGICWFDPENHRPTGHNLRKTFGFLHSTEPIIKSISTSWTYDQQFNIDFIPGEISVEFEWVDTDGNMLSEGASYGGRYSFDDPIAHLPLFTFVGPLDTLDDVILQNAAGIKQTITVTPGDVNLIADVGLTGATIWLGAQL